MHGEQQIAEEQRVGLGVGDDQVVVGMRGGLRFEQQRAAAEIERELVLDGEGGQDDLDALEGLLARASAC